jgi:ABC-type transport system involved in cytochrome c biogenesis ATPase subunit
MEQGIIAEAVTKVYSNRKRQGWFRSVREEKVAVKDVSFRLPPGQVTGLLGLNGAGKTTTIKMLSTLLLPTAGRITVDGLDMQQHTTAIRKRVNMIAGGERMVYWRLTGRENLWYFAQLYDVEPRGLKERIDYLLQLVGLEDAADTVVERYSKGMKQRLQIARGLINDPTYLFQSAWQFSWERFHGTLELLFLSPANRLVLIVANGTGALIQSVWLFLTFTVGLITIIGGLNVPIQPCLYWLSLDCSFRRWHGPSS